MNTVKVICGKCKHTWDVHKGAVIYSALARCPSCERFSYVKRVGEKPEIVTK